MRATCLVLFSICLAGCGRIDSSHTSAVPDQGNPAASPAGNSARAPSTGTDTASHAATATGNRAVDANAPAAGTQPDNTAVNSRDTNRETREPKLPIDQKEDRADVDMTAKIRQRVVKTDGLSINARNCKIITADGHVTLRGPVDSEAEHDTIVKIARDVAGDSNVDDQLEVKSSASSSTTTTPATTNP
jgi:hyperosmotically inducible periplasmic protein